MRSSRTAPLGEIWFSLPSSDRDLASTGTSFETITLEVMGFTLRVATIRGEPRTWFASIFVASTIGLVFETYTR